MLRLVQLFPIILLILILAIGALVIGGIIYTIVKNISRKPVSQAVPELTTAAAVVAKREQHGRSIHHPVSSQYFVTFQFPSKDRMEFQVSSQDYGILVEGDVGRLTFRGDQFLCFKREL